jgi:hypothetical protein
MKFVSASYLSEQFNNFNDAGIEEIIIGPRQAVTLLITPIIWIGIYGKYLETYPVRFSVISDFNKVSDLFNKIPYDFSEIGYLGPDKNIKTQKEGAYHLRFSCERQHYEFTFKCGKISIGEPSPFKSLSTREE